MKTWNYIAIFLDEASKKRLKRGYHLCPEGWTWHGDHITLAFNNGCNPDEDARSVGLQWGFGSRRTAYITGYAWTDKVKAVRVETVCGGVKRILHITLATAPGVEPKASNNIPADEWKDECGIPVDGKIGYSLNGEVFFKQPYTGDDAKVWSVLQGFDFQKRALMSLLRESGVPVSEEQYYKAERAMRKAFVESVTGRSAE